MIRKLSALVIGLALAACGGVKPPPQLSPVGQVSFYSAKAGEVVASLQKFTIDAELAGVIQKADRQAVGKATEKVSAALIDLEDALAAGSGKADAKKKALAIIAEALRQLPDHLSPDAAKLIQPYIDQILILLAFIG